MLFCLDSVSISGLRWGRLVVLLFACVGTTGLQAGAQTSVDGAVGGTIIDARGGRVANADISFLQINTGFRAGTRTDAQGGFLVPRLAPGDYRVIVEAANFRRIEVSPVTVAVGATVSLVLPLGLSGTSVSVNVEAQSAAADSQEGAANGVSNAFSPTELQRLPVDGRRWQSFALLSIGANPDSDGSGLISFRGIAANQNATSIDGVNDDQSYGGVPSGNTAGSPPGDADSSNEGSPDDTSSRFASGEGSGRHPSASYTFSQEAVEELRVTAQTAPSLLGHAAGGIITTISKSGSNDRHGSAFYFVRSSALAATNPFSLVTHFQDHVVSSHVVKPTDLRQQFGGSIGGPLLRDRLFYFYTFDQQHRNFPAISSPASANFYALTPIQRGLLANRGVRASSIDAALTYLDSLSGIVPRQSNQTIHFAKLTWQATPRQRFSLQANRARSSAPAGVRMAPVVSRGRASIGDSRFMADSILGRWLWSHRASLSNEVRLQYRRDLQMEQPQTPLAQEPAVGPGGYVPEITIGPNGFIFGTSASLTRRAYPDERRMELVDLVTISHHRHLLQSGADVSFVHDSLQTFQNQEGTFSYDSGTTGGKSGGLVDWITDYTFNVNAYPNGGCPSINAAIHYFCFRTFSQSFGAQAVEFNTQEWSGFFQDTWRVRPGLTVVAGVRYEYELLPLPQQPNRALDAIFGTTGATSVFPEDRNNVGPRLSFAWEPHGGGVGVVRLGYGVYFGRLPGATIRSALVNTATPSSITHIRILPTTITLCPQVANQGFGYPCAYVAAPPAAIATTTSATVFDHRFRLPTLQEGNLSLEHEIAGGVLITATYLLTIERQLPNSVDLNILPSTSTGTFQLQGGSGSQGVLNGETFSIPVYSKRRTSQFGPVTDVISNGNGSYNALALEARRRGSGSLDLRASWTWSKALTFSQATSAVPRTNAQFDPFNNRYDKALSPLNYPQKVVVAAVWHPALATDQPLLRATVNHWLLAPILTASSGRPYSYDVFGGPRLPGGHESINGSGGAVYLPTIGPNTLRLPPRWRIDLRLSRDVKLREGITLTTIAEAFNLTNHVAFSGVAQRAFLVGTPSARGVTPLVFQDAATISAEGLNTLPFGTYTEAASGNARERQLQMGLRLRF